MDPARIIAIPKRRDREQRGELVLQHMNPTSLNFRTVRLKVGHARNADALEFTLGAQDFQEALRFRTCFGISIEMYDIIWIAWARPFRERSEFFRECLSVFVGEDFDAFFWGIAVWMEDLCADRRKNDSLRLGHQSIQTTELCLRTDPADKLDMLSQWHSPGMAKERFTGARDDLMAKLPRRARNFEPVCRMECRRSISSDGMMMGSATVPIKKLLLHDPSTLHDLRITCRRSRHP